MTFSWGYFIWDELTACHNIKLSFKKEKEKKNYYNLWTAKNVNKIVHFSLGTNSCF